MTLITLDSKTGHYSQHISRLPDNADRLNLWFESFINDADKGTWPAVLEPAVAELQVLIESKAELRMLATSMFHEVPNKEPFNKDPLGRSRVRDYRHMLQLLNMIMTGIAPGWNMVQYNMGLIGAPINALFNWPMATPSGYAFFLREDVNAKLKVILDTWRNTVLKTHRSLYVVTARDGGWLSKEALRAIEKETMVNGQPWHPFQDLFVCDPAGDPLHWGFKSWDDFFVRQFRDIDKVRPVAHPNKPEWVVSPCEATPYALKSNVQRHDEFWIKGQNYSVAEMLNFHEFADQFVGGTVYQAFLGAISYHRWSSPVSGHVVEANVVNGTYFSEPQAAGFMGSKEGPDPCAPNRSQVYISHVATRAIIFIQAAEPIGLMCIITIGMADISTCEILDKFASSLPQPVQKGEEIGMFHHGGSSCCLLFRKGVNLMWAEGAIPGTGKTNAAIRSALAMAQVN